MAMQTLYSLCWTWGVPSAPEFPQEIVGGTNKGFARSTPATKTMG
jgi:hypothetical protein